MTRADERLSGRQGPAAASLDAPPLFRLAGREGARLDLEAPGGARAHVFVLEPDIFRVLVLPRGRLEGPRTWAIAPGLADTPWAGRDRFDVTGFSRPDFALETAEDGLVVTTKRLRLRLAFRNLRCRWAMKTGPGRAGEEWLDIAADRPTQAYDFGWWGGKPRHYLKRAPGEAYYGLGERAGPMNRAGRRYRLMNQDAMGYDAETSDPLYKHIPFYLTRVNDQGDSFGLFYDTLADCAFDFGCERSNYHGLYRGFEAEAGDLDYYLIAGPAPLDVTRRFTWLTGRPARLPRWSLGYSGSGMAYADDPAPLARMRGFIAACAAHDIPCASFHLSSGYTLRDGRRYVFVWNREAFPDPSALAGAFAARGLKVLANVKPCLLTDHPRFAEAAAAGLFIAGPDGAPDLAQFWDGVGGYLDFTNPATLAWWKGEIGEALLDHGVAGVWNDNNEFEVRSPAAVVAGFGAPLPAVACKPLQSLLMMRASREAQVERAPDARPMGVSRAGAVGMHRYVQTWSGDNTTHWKTPRWNSRMGLGLALSGVANFGHDIGGFAGPTPDAELFVRWVGAGVFLPRFSIHSWNDDGGVNEPWMYPEALGAVRALLALRHRFAPWLYELLRRHAESFEPVLRPLFLDFPGDPEAWSETDPFLVGPDLLAAPPFDPGVADVTLRPPVGADWRDYWTGRLIPGGEAVALPCPWDRPPILIRAGAVIPLDLSPAAFDPAPPHRAALIAPPAAGPIAGFWTEDDGISVAGPETMWRVEGLATPDRLDLTLRRAPSRTADTLTLVLPATETRPLRVEGAEVAETLTVDGEHHTRLRLARTT